jgi:acyl-coenzyme A synthetase/AMP-(fatty) acid ligase
VWIVRRTDVVDVSGHHMLTMEIEPAILHDRGAETVVIGEADEDTGRRWSRS